MLDCIDLVDGSWQSREGVHFCGDLLYNGELADAFEIFADVFTFEEFTDVLDDSAGHFSVILEHDEEVFLATDRIRSLPLFYTDEPDVIVSDQFSRLLEDVPEEQISLSTAIEFLQSRIVAESNTLHPNIKKVRTGEAVQLSEEGLVKREQYYQYRYHPDRQKFKTSTDFSKKITDVLDVVFTRLSKAVGDDPVILSLSAGLDSRLIAYWLKRHEFDDVYAFTYYIGDYEHEVAKYTAEQLGFQWTGIDLGADEFVDYLQSKTREVLEDRYGGYGTKIPNPRTSLSLRTLRECDDLPDKGYVITGYQMFGAPNKFPESLYGNDSLSKLRHLSELLDWKYSYLQPTQPVEHILREQLASTQYYREYDDTVDIRTAIEMLDRYYLYENHASKGDGNMLLYKYWEYDMWYPYYDPAYIDFLSSVPLEMRLNRDALREFVSGLDSQYFPDPPERYTDPTETSRPLIERLILGTPFEQPAKLVKSRLFDREHKLSTIDKHVRDDGTLNIRDVEEYTQSQIFKIYFVIDQVARSPIGVDDRLKEYYNTKLLR